MLVTVACVMSVVVLAGILSFLVLAVVLRVVGLRL
jgi:hypothetical protein